MTERLEIKSFARSGENQEKPKRENINDEQEKNGLGLPETLSVGGLFVVMFIVFLILVLGYNIVLKATVFVVIALIAAGIWFRNGEANVRKTFVKLSKFLLFGAIFMIVLWAMSEGMNLRRGYNLARSYTKSEQAGIIKPAELAKGIYPVNQGEGEISGWFEPRGKIRIESKDNGCLVLTPGGGKIACSDVTKIYKQGPIKIYALTDQRDSLLIVE
jgi:hypothetical protein